MIRLHTTKPPRVPKPRRFSHLKQLSVRREKAVASADEIPNDNLSRKIKNILFPDSVNLQPSGENRLLPPAGGGREGGNKWLLLNICKTAPSLALPFRPVVWVLRRRGLFLYI
jgi:hypothetical protein